ncbi:hypothetical protein QNO07_03430 [Streptomyces sp. 549]|uniref:hypothetical protein n=1 Tax=Streptomyces sp. 549 TaxID=3049076 RepID=UPI0024C270C9|nr:hypothetical protein [Streptomyces sp. 549]MDK1472485.1 hypothetical protein [Streptomyces sp. 549]
MARPARTVCLLDWHADTPYGLTAVAVPADELSEAEEVAAPLAGEALPVAWVDADPALLRRLVAMCRPIPTTGFWHVYDDRPVTDEARARRDCLRVFADEWPDAERLPVDQADHLPGLTALVRLAALGCRVPPEAEEWLDEDEDIHDTFDTFTVGVLPADWH